MAKLTELLEVKIKLDDVFYLGESKEKTTFIEVIDKYAIEFAVFCESRDNYFRRFIKRI